MVVGVDKHGSGVDHWVGKGVGVALDVQLPEESAQVVEYLISLGWREGVCVSTDNNHRGVRGTTLEGKGEGREEGGGGGGILFQWQTAVHVGYVKELGGAIQYMLYCLP